jgi:hypothetical protein
MKTHAADYISIFKSPMFLKENIFAIFINNKELLITNR